MTFSWTRVGAIFHKELRDYRRNRFVVVFTMSLLPLIFVVLPVVQLFTIPASTASHQLDTRIGISLLYMLLIPTIVPSALAAYSVVGEREQGTLEPVLTTPISREEFLVGKALAVLAPTLAVSYAVFGIFLAAAALFAHPAVESAVFEGSHILVQLVFTPLLAGWSIWAGIAVSTRTSDVRAAQQLSLFASLPPLAVVALMSLNVVTPTTGLALGLAAVLLLIDGLGWRTVSAMFDRERLITGARGWRATQHRSARHRTRHGQLTNAAGATATLRLTREGRGIELRKGTFEVALDGTDVGSIDRGETLELPLEPGDHTLLMRAGRYSSLDRSFHVNDGEVVGYRCHATMLWPRYVASVVVPNLGISLKPR